jgi:iron(III) transport system substrate-binding protein
MEGEVAEDRFTVTNTRRSFLQAAVLGGAALGLGACGSSSNSTSSPSASATSPGASSLSLSPPSSALIKAAQAEGTLTLYGGLPPNALAKLVGGFTGVYGIQVASTRLIDSVTEPRVTAEIQSGKPVADIIIVFDSNWLATTAIPKNFLATADPATLPAIAHWDPRFVMNNQAFVQSLAPFDAAYNVNNVKAADVPKKWTDVLKPQFKGQILLTDPRVNTSNLAWFYFLWKKYGDSFLTGLKDQKFQVVASSVPGINEVGSGDVSLLMPVNHWITEPLIQQGAPVADSYISPTLAALGWIGMIAKSPHPNAAQLFLNYSLSQAGIFQECQNLCSSVLNIPGTIPFDTTTYEASPTAQAAAARSTVLGLMGLA